MKPIVGKDMLQTRWLLRPQPDVGMFKLHRYMVQDSPNISLYCLTFNWNKLRRTIEKPVSVPKELQEKKEDPEADPGAPGATSASTSAVTDKLILSTNKRRKHGTETQVQSEFQKAYEKGDVHKSKFWEPTFEDALNLIARVPVVASYVYRRMYKDGSIIPLDDSLDYGANFSHMLGFDSPQMKELMRLYVTIHSDHEGGNVSAYEKGDVHKSKFWEPTFVDALDLIARVSVASYVYRSDHEGRNVSAHAGHLVGSDLSFAAALNGLAGPLHGLANQEVLLWIKSVVEKCGENISKEQLKDYVWKTLNSGKVVPGYGHGVLHKTIQDMYAKESPP